ncbi:hypothetical protein K491DRAFT_603275 [Lophiostoma macrostomum CBS 122681]|uniref:Zn(2)-C6 fungal-type domain-containing protein n=1 Tax=Lophiostoma macrostomum CBS 122681 TaxID=1314788 RepID=A0A6A6SZP5_9PLEO|nr:hypothetical protein K491DRAFT_603275 [Lophiostoma macrostomum CBS 122681]
MSAEPQAQACDRCHRRKTRCDKRRPECTACIKASVACAYSTRTKEPLYRRDYVEKLERRARQLELNNRALEDRLATVSGTDPPPTNLESQHSNWNIRDSNTQRGGMDTESNDDTNSPAPIGNDIASEVTFLSTHAGGDRQFLGSASGLFLASLVRGAVREETETSSLRLASPGNGVTAKSNWSIDHDTLPPRQMTNSLIDAYMAHDALCYPILAPSVILTIVDAMYADRAYPRTARFGAFAFHMLLSIGTAQVYKFNWQILPDAETHHQRAMVYLDSVLSRGGIEAIQALLLCCQYRLSSSTKDASGSLWHLVGIAARMCFELGLHRETSYPLKDHDTLMVDETALAQHEAQEVRRRCFWCVFCLDRVVSITLGRPLALHIEDIDVELPSVVGNELAFTPTENANSPGSLRMAASYRVAIFVHIVRYRALCGKFLTSLHRGGRQQIQSQEQFQRTRSRLAEELESWRLDTVSLKLPEIDLATPLAEARSSFRSKAWYELLYQNGILLLYRPSPATNDDESDSLRRIHSAAKQSVTLYAYLFKSRKINFSWITLHTVFLAGLSYIYSVSSHLRERRKQRKNTTITPRNLDLAQDPTIVEIVNDTRACSNVLVAVSERCNAPKNCHEVFDRLSDAVLADAVELYTSPHAVAPSLEGSSTYGAYSQPPDNSLTNADSSTAHALGSTEFPQYLSNDYMGQDLLAVDNVLRDSLPDLQHIYDTSWADDAILQLSMDWLQGIDSGNGLYDTSI